MALEYPAGPEGEQKVLNLLKQIEKDCAGDDELAHVTYELKALVSIEIDDSASIITDCYTVLRRSETYSSIALSLVWMIINNVMSSPELKPVNELRTHIISRMSTYDTQVRIPRLLLRRSLAEIAHDLDKSEKENFITVAAEELKPLNPERLGKSAPIFQLFERLEERGLVSHTSKEFPIMARFLRDINRPDLIQTLKQNDIDRPIYVAATIELQSKFVLGIVFIWGGVGGGLCNAGCIDIA